MYRPALPALSPRPFHNPAALRPTRAPSVCTRATITPILQAVILVQQRPKQNKRRPISSAHGHAIALLSATPLGPSVIPSLPFHFPHPHAALPCPPPSYLARGGQQEPIMQLSRTTCRTPAAVVQPLQPLTRVPLWVDEQVDVQVLLVALSLSHPGVVEAAPALYGMPYTGRTAPSVSAERIRAAS